MYSHPDSNVYYQNSWIAWILTCPTRIYTRKFRKRAYIPINLTISVKKALSSISSPFLSKKCPCLRENSMETSWNNLNIHIPTNKIQFWISKSRITSIYLIKLMVLGKNHKFYFQISFFRIFWLCVQLRLHNNLEAFCAKYFILYSVAQ